MDHKLRKIECCVVLPREETWHSITGSSMAIEVRVASRWSPEDLSYDTKVGPTSDSRGGSTREIRVESLVTFSVS